jgi:Putative adhesin
MTRWTIDSPRTLELPGVAALKVRVVSGSVAILASQDAPSLDVASLTGQPLLVTHEAGILTITYEDLQLDGLKGWLHPQRHSADVTVTVPADCPTQLGVVNASAIVSGISASISAKSVSGDITLDGVTGNVDAKTVSGDVEARGIDGEVAFNSVSGGLTLAGGAVSKLAAKTVSGQVTADIELQDGGGLKVSTVSGDVAVRVPASASARVDLKSASGRVRSSFDGMTAAPGRRPTAMSATIGSGSADLTVSSMTGDVTLLARVEPPSPGEKPAPAEPAAPPAPGEEPAASEPAAPAAGPGDPQ